jgi:hypothetical protein
MYFRHWEQMVTEKEHQRDLKKIKKAIQESNDMLRRIGIKLPPSEQQIHVPEQKPQLKPRATK